MSATSRLGSSGPYARPATPALVMTRLDTAAMNLFLAELGQAVAPDVHGIVLMDKAGWHTSGELVVPENLSLVFLPPYSPELNPIERLWLHLIITRRNRPPGSMPSRVARLVQGFSSRSPMQSALPGDRLSLRQGSKPPDHVERFILMPVCHFSGTCGSTAW